MKNFSISIYHYFVKIYGQCYLLILFFIPLVLSNIWFKGEGTLMAAEEGPLFYNLNHTYQLYSHIWTDSGLGLANPLITSRIPTYFLLSQLSYLGLPASFLQQCLFFTLLIVPLMFMPLLIWLYFPEPKNAGKISAVFYMLNLYTQSQIWHRFLYPQMFLWSYLPLFLYLFTMWIKTQKGKYLLFLILSSFCYSLMFSFLSTIMVLWTCAGLITLGFLIINIRQSYKYLLRSIAALFVWLLSNIWWVIPLYTTQNNNYSSALDSSKNLYAVVEVSKYFTNKTIFLLKQAYYFAENPTWGIYLYNDFVPWLAVLMVIVGIIVNLKKYNAKVFLVILFVGWFVSKGANPPFGVEFFNFIFSQFSLTQILRNPFEKFGLVFLLPYAVFFGLGLSYLLRKKILILTALIFICGGAVKPMWDGTIFAGYKVVVPDTYAQINQIIENDNTHRLLSMPFLHTANAAYTWGYKGEELSELFISKPILSRTYNAPGDIYPFLYRHIRDEKFTKLFPILGIDSVLLHRDAITRRGYHEGYEDSKKIIESWEDIDLITETNELVLYKYTKKNDWGYISTHLVYEPDVAKAFEKVVSGEINPETDAFTDNTNATLLMKDIKPPQVKIEKRSSHLYRAYISDVTDPYLLVISTTFNENWMASSSSTKFTRHVKVNGFANGWIIDKKGDYTIDVVFKVWPWQ